MNDYKKQATLWYEAFSRNEPTILDRILSEDWVDIPSLPGTPAGPAGVKPLLARLKTTFPDLNLNEEVSLTQAAMIEAAMATLRDEQREAVALSGLSTMRRGCSPKTTPSLRPRPSMTACV
jgi:hypothetical protein